MPLGVNERKVYEYKLKNVSFDAGFMTYEEFKETGFLTSNTQTPYELMIEMIRFYFVGGEDCFDMLDSVIDIRSG